MALNSLSGVFVATPNFYFRPNITGASERYKVTGYDQFLVVPRQTDGEVH